MFTDDEKDYIMRMIKEIARVLASVMLGKKYVQVELPVEKHSFCQSFFVSVIDPVKKFVLCLVDLASVHHGFHLVKLVSGNLIFGFYRQLDRTSVV